MGVIDEVKYSVHCPSCNASENVTIVEKGSAYGSNWKRGRVLVHFTVEWSEPTKIDAPEITSIQCKGCGSTPVVSRS